MKNYHKTVRTLKKARFLSMWAAVFALAASLVLTGCPNQASSPAGGGESTQGTTITINYNPDELAVEKKDTANGKWTEIPSGTAVDEGTRLWFEAKNLPSGKMVDKWVLNGKKEVKQGYGYSIKTEDAVEEGGKKVITVTRTLKDAASITINYNSDELTVKDTYNGTDITSGTAVNEGTRLWFEAKNLPSGKMVDKWVLNGKKEVKQGYGYSIKTEDAVEEGGKKVITVTRTLKDAASITINYNPDELTVEKKDTANGKWTEIPSGTAVDEGTELFFEAKNIPPGKILEKWVLNNGKKEVKPNHIYDVNPEDAVDEGGKKVIRIERILKDATSITINYNADEMTIENTNGWTNIPSGTAVDEGTHLLFEAKNIPSGKMVEKWLLNGKKEVRPHAVYSVSAEDAVEEGGKKVIKVERILKDAASITIKYNSDEMTIKKRNNDNWETLPTDTPVDEGTYLRFEAKNGQTVNKWILNGKKELHPYVIYSVRPEDAVEEGSKKVIVVTFE